MYSVHPSVSYAQSILRGLPEKTGRSLEEWSALLHREAPPEVAKRRAWLTERHGVGGTTASMIAEASLGQGRERTDPAEYLEAASRYVESMFEGRESLRPIFDAVLEEGRSLGPDVRICPCRTIVPLYRAHVFAQLKPATRTRLDLGLALKGVAHDLPTRIVPTGGLEKGDRITHRFALTSIEQVDSQVREWLGIAYRLDVPAG